MTILNIPYGLADFEKIICNGYFYQDRTDKIPFIEQAGEQLLFIRPRRFGKSLLLSMLENYYDINKAAQFEQLFGHLQIGQNPTPLHNHYFVLKWDFSSIPASGEVKEIERAIHKHINICIEEFAAYYHDALSVEIAIDLEDALISLRSLLIAVRQTPYKLYLLIDEYDNFANEVMMAEKSHYHALLKGEGLLKTVFKNIKSAAGGLGLDRVFITGVSPVVMSDMTSGYNVATNIYLEPEFNDLCGFTEAEVQQLLARLPLAEPQQTEALDLMRTFYNGYRFYPTTSQSMYNPTLSLYFVRALQKHQAYPANLLDENLAMDRNKLQYIAHLPHGEALIVSLLGDEPLQINQLSERFGVADMLYAVKDQTFMASLLYYFGILTLTGVSDSLGQLQLSIPNLVARTLYVERLKENLLPDYSDRITMQRAAEALYLRADLQPLCEFIEQRYFNILSNRDYRWSNELILKIAFMTLLYNDQLYMMVSETESNRRYVDLSLIVRPDKRMFKALDLVLEFKYLDLTTLGLSAEQLRNLDNAALLQLTAVKKQLDAANRQAQDYMHSLQQQYPEAKLHGLAVLGIGFERVLWRAVV